MSIINDIKKITDVTVREILLQQQKQLDEQKAQLEQMLYSAKWAQLKERFEEIRKLHVEKIVNANGDSRELLILAMQRALICLRMRNPFELEIAIEEYFDLSARLDKFAR